MKKIIYILFLLIILYSFSAYAEKGHMTLLTVGERGNETMGGTADVYLEVTPGSGRVFIDSFPLTKLDTQISTRFAKEVACDFLDEDCSNKDFFYTIRAKSSVVGGPSAGAALTVLTISVLEKLELDESVVMTGTINSGGIIGPVAGIEEKAEAAKREGFKKALVPKRSIISVLDSNLSVNKQENEDENRSDGAKNITLIYSDSLEVEGIEIVPISTIEDALFHFTGKKYPDYSYELDVPETYMNIMNRVSSDICQRTKEIMQIIPKQVLENHSEKYNLSESFIDQAEDAFSERDYYTAASFCFNANRYLRDIEYSQYSEEELSLIAKDAKQELEGMIKEIDGKLLYTLSELETSMVVKERLFEAEELLESFSNGSYEYGDLAYIVERIYSAKAWSAFFDHPGKEVILDENHLSGACLEKIAEAEERINYFEILFGEYEDYRNELEDAREIYNSGDYAFCLFKASRIKADVNAILTSLSITDEKFQELLDDQLRLARVQINKQRADFPIIGYSYYNYAESLKETRPELSLIYSEYASEFSNLDMYFPTDRRESFFIDWVQLGLFLLGFSAGIFFVMIFYAVFSRYGRKKVLNKDNENKSIQKSTGAKGSLKKFRPVKKKRS